MGKYFLGSVGMAEAFRKDENGEYKLAFVSKTLTDSGLNISTTKDDIRAGTGAPIQFSFYHDANVEITLTDVLWKKEYLTAQLGAQFDKAGQDYTTETVTVAEAGKIVVSKDPISLPIACAEGDAKLGWYTIQGKDEWTAATFTGKELAVAAATVGQKYCVRYLAANDNAKVAEITATIVPEELFLIITAPLFAGDACEASKGKAAGHITFEVPRFQLNGAQDFAMNMSQNQNMSLAGIALAGASENCEDMGGKLLRIIEVITAENWAADAEALIIDEDCLKANTAIDAYALLKNGSIKKINDVTGEIEIKLSTATEYAAPTQGKWGAAGTYDVRLKNNISVVDQVVVGA